MKRLLVFISFLILGCGPDPIPAPEPVVLLAPANLNACNTATRVNDFERQVRFQWSAALNTESYELVVENSLSREQVTMDTTILTESITLPSGATYQWYVVSKSLLTEATGKSAVWQFYLEGNPEASYLPFPAVLLEPFDEEEVSLSGANTFIFKWKGVDLDDDIISYDLYLGLTENELIKERDGIGTSQSSIELNSDTIYFWQVVTMDSEGNQSYSEIFQFRTL